MFDLKKLWKENMGSGEYAEVLAKAGQALADAVTARQDDIDRRPILLIEGTIGEIEKLDAQILRGNTEVERIKAQIGVLRDRQAWAKKQEHEASLDKVYADADEKRRRGHVLLKQYSAAAEDMVKILDELHAVHGFIRHANEQLKQAGRDKVNSPEGELTAAADAPRAAPVERHVKLPQIVDPEGSEKLWPRRNPRTGMDLEY